ncbi:deoxynucleoside triphosphate triphosphohydrolase SAMHD1-like [Parambassis ranga]|uniref:Deoxynucleoside triphosphate triphosphohydrolase SAMHD1 n=1 Tax=Parambassis ranga TaxID=210632 RepID=A0A6P7IKC6_9TELE|nr:deoxynucleoside triphosphate triphosphohydrolase SAMHD1-like [Parambassis ranga]
MVRPADIKYWTEEEVGKFLKDEGLGKWEQTFKEKKITGDQLLDLKKLKETVTDGDDYENLRKAIKKHMETYCSKVINDPIHGHMELHPLLVKIIDTPQFQRLRNIKQLGGAYFVYPGASHNRFEHSIGVGYLAGELAKALKSKQPELDITDTDILCVQIAGLCHDLGHGPFSHLYDQMFIPSAFPNDDPQWKHEKASVQMLDHMVETNNLQSSMELYGLNLQTDLKFIKEMIAPQKTDLKQRKDEGPQKTDQERRSFLYEIVSNPITGIDVDKFDYFARDCHHLGIKNNFDHMRFIKFARVCENHICSRDKEVINLYDMFATRHALHRRAYQHKVNKNIELMITDAFLKADKHIQIEGSGGKMFSLSQAKDDMEAYTKLTDQVMEQILHSSLEMEGARSLLQRILTRDLYFFVGEAKKKDASEFTKEEIKGLKQKLAEHTGAEKDNFEVVQSEFDYGKDQKDPIENAFFYTKGDHSKGYKISRNRVSMHLPSVFSENFIRVYWKTKEDQRRYHKIQKAFHDCCKKKGFIATVGERAQPEQASGGASGNNAGPN